MKEKKLERNSNFELMRIVSMFLIIMWHFIFHGSLLSKTTGSLNTFIHFIYIIMSIHVNSFVLVSGYFQYNKKFKVKKVISLILITWFYKLLYAIIFGATGMAKISITEMLFFFQPFNFNYGHGEFYWFINMYLFLYLLSPFLNKLIQVLSQKQHKYLAILLFIMLSVVPTVTLNQTLVNNGYTIQTFVMLYIIGAYFGKYKLKDNYHFKRYSKNKYQFIIIVLFIFSLFMSIIPKIISDYFSTSNLEILDYIRYLFGLKLIDYISPVIIIESILYLLLFETFNFKSKFINKVSSLTFGIYLVHENNFLVQYIFNRLPIAGNISVIPEMFCFSIVVFILSAIVEYIRQVLAKVVTKTKAYQKLSQRISNYVANF